MHRLARMFPAMVAVGWFTWSASASPAHGQILFTQVLNPSGVTADLNGNVFIQHDSGFQNLLTKFAPNGVAVASIAIGGFLDLGLTGRLATDPASGFILYLTQSGLLFLISPDTLQFVDGANFRALPLDVSAVYDVGTGSVRDFSGLIIPGQITYGDIAVFRRSDQLDLFMTGTSGITAFVMRVRILPDGTMMHPKVLLSSTLSAAELRKAPRGVTVNTSGLGLTTLPVLSLPVSPFVLESYVLFSPDMEPESGPLPVVGQIDFASRGMSSDGAGNFYVAAGSLGDDLCRVTGSGALVFLSASLDTLRCFTLGVAVAESRDVAASPGNDRAYMTLASGHVVFFPLP